MSDERRAPYLHIVGREGGTAGDMSRGSAARAARAGSGGTASGTAGGEKSGLANALMYACVSWVALVREETAQSVDLTPIGQLSYEADVLLESGERLLLRVELKVEPGSWRVRTVVEPARPV